MVASINQQVEMDAHLPNARKAGVPRRGKACRSTHGNVTEINPKQGGGQEVIVTCSCCKYTEKIT